MSSPDIILAMTFFACLTPFVSTCIYIISIWEHHRLRTAVSYTFDRYDLINGSCYRTSVGKGKEMRKSVLLSMMLIAAFLLGACGSTSSTSSLATSQSDVMAPALELAAKTLRLESTDQAIDSEMAAQLLPLWQLMDELSTNGATAPQEVTAVIEQIEATMTPEQIKAMDEMDIAQGDLFAAGTRNRANSSGNGAATSGSSSGNTNVVGAMAGAGGPPAGGGFPGGDPGAGGPGSGANVQQSTSSSQTSGTTSLITQVINLLESKMKS